ncbi:flagellar filament capping protein FliD, partial [Acinetobacter baumannii]
EAAPVYNSLGLAELVKNLADDLTNSVSGRLAQRDKDLQDQITLQNSRIADFDVRLAAKREQLTAQFTAMEQAIGKLRTQQNSISS